MERESFVKRYDIPQMLWGGFLLLAFVALIAPYIDWFIVQDASGPTINDFDLRNVSAPARTLFAYIGPVLFLAAIGIHVPIFRVPQAGKEQDSVRQVECEGLGAGEEMPGDGYVLVDFLHGQKEWDDFSAGIHSVFPAFCRPRASLAAKGVLDGARVAVIALSKVERLAPSEIDAIANWVEGGGGLLLLGYYAWTHHDTDINDLAGRLGFEFSDNLVLPGDAAEYDTRRQVFHRDPKLVVWLKDLATHPVLSGVRAIGLQSSATIRMKSGTRDQLALRPRADVSIWEPRGELAQNGVRAVIESYVRVEADPDPMLIAFRRGRGRVVAIGTWKVVAFDLGDNRRLVQNAIDWLARED